MTNYGKIKTYDSDNGTGTISPERGGDAIPFGKSDLQQEGQMPVVDQRYGYETRQDNGGNRRAVKLQQQGEGQSQEEQARNQRG